ncbi:MAG: ribosomal-protein-alanine N-acetyltransferase [Thermoprotei archaeon]|nr:MAG: ribosomal-protein-alanine N-acetyltransferase [Thermoprotei archaeon]
MSNTSIHVETIYSNALEILKTKAPGFIIRNARQDDIERVVYINRKCLPENYPVYFFEDLLKHYGKAFYVAQSPEGEVVGYVMTRVEWKPGFFKKFLARSLHIVSIAVLPLYRRRGLGYALMAHAMKSGYEEYKCSETYLEVRVSNTPAISLYEKLGYRVMKIAHSYYLDGEDAYIMARPLP